MNALLLLLKYIIAIIMAVKYYSVIYSVKINISTFFSGGVNHS